MQVSVDDDFARFGAKSYAINKINSVEVREREPHGRAGAVIFGLIAAFFAFGLLASLFSANAPPPGPGPFIMVAICGGLAWWLWQLSKIREYDLFLMTSSSETQAFVTRDADQVMSLRAQIEGAMLRHSRAGTDR